jgi:type IX secretion system PorP/SprF family membrane protein
MKKLYLIFLLLATGFVKTYAQDPNFSQFFASPLTLNPALTGKFDGTVRIAGNYRNQWPSIPNAFITATTSVDFAVMKNRIPETDRWGIGILAMNDKSANGTLVTNNFSLSTSYHKGLDEDGYHTIGVAAQGTYTSRRLDVNKLLFESQLTPNGFDISIDPGESFKGNNLNVSYFDLQAGVLYSGSSSQGNNFYVGASMYHINRPKESFKNGFYILNSRVTFHGGGYFPIGQSMTLHASAMHSSQGKATNTTVGAAMSFLANGDESNPTNFYAGGWMRFGDAIIPYVGLEFGGLRIGATYDVNISSLKPASQSRGGMEVSLIYIKKPIEHRSIPCPKF